MNTKAPTSKYLRLRQDYYDRVESLADALTKERGATVTKPEAVAEAVKFYSDYRDQMPLLRGQTK